MDVLNTVPEVRNIRAYGGDTCSIKITAPATVTDGMVWHAEIRSTSVSPDVDATFLITEPVVSGGPAFVTLLSVDSARLASKGVPVTKRNPDGSIRTVILYSGVWDCQVSANKVDPVRTLVQGMVEIELDVTRPS